MIPVSCTLYAVTGRPVLHSKSPLLFQPLFDAVSHTFYLRLAARTAAEAISAAQRIGISGLNVTAPFKEEMLRFAAHTDPAARNIGAANVILLSTDGSVTASNTDHAGVIGALTAAGCNPAGKRAIVLGAGGAARAAVYGLVRHGAQVTIVNRTFEKGKNLAAYFSCDARPLEELAGIITETNILVTTIPNPGAVFTNAHLHAGLIVLDADYRGSTLMRLCEECGARYLSGREWLFHQASPSYRLFIGADPDTAVMRMGLNLPWPPADRPLALIGFMGSGKTTVGRLLAARTGRSFIDTDAIIEHATGTTISALFTERGESFFREREKEALAAALKEKHAVIACGGGVVTDAENRRHLREQALVFWLFTDGATARRRIGTDSTRPLFGPDADTILATRKPFYAETAHLVVDTTPLAPGETADLIAEELRRLP